MIQNSDANWTYQLDSACPQAKTELDKHVHKFREWSVDKEEYRQEASHLLN